MKRISLINPLKKDNLLVPSLIVGVLCGLAAVVLKISISYIGGLLTSLMDKGDPWFYLYLVLPGIGMLLAMLFVRFVVKDDISHGVTKVLQAVSTNNSQIKSHNTWTSVAASAITIGFGGSVGAEAPIVYTGAAIGSTMARKFGMSYRNMTILLGCGAAGAVAGIFKAPLAGVLFTLEILLFNISMSSLLPVLVSSVSATVVSCLILGTEPMFACSLEAFRMRNIVWYVLLGVFCSIVSLYFTRTTLAVEDRMKLVSRPSHRWALGALALGFLIFLFPQLYGEGYNTVDLFLSSTSSLEFNSIFWPFLSEGWGVPVFIALVMLLKVFSMSLTNAGGGVGGTFGPTLVVGAFAGFIISRSINLLAGAGGGVGVHEQNFILVGMAGLMAGVMQAPMTAIFLIAEISGGYELLIPLIITSATSFGITHSIEPYSIYSKRIASAGELLTHDNDKSVLTLLKLSSLVSDKYPRVDQDMTLGAFVQIMSTTKVQVYPVVDSSDRLLGIVEIDKVRKKLFDQRKYNSLRVFNIMESPDIFVSINDSMDSVMEKFENTGAWRIPVIDQDGKYCGFVSRSRILSAYRDELRQISHD